jgi:hypothetical protein
MRGLCAILIFLFGAIAVGCDMNPFNNALGTGIIEGKVVKASDGTPIQSASVLTDPVVRADTTIVTDRNGVFIIQDVPANSYKVHIFHEEYTLVTLDVEVTKGSTVKPLIVLGALVAAQSDSG